MPRTAGQCLLVLSSYQRGIVSANVRRNMWSISPISAPFLIFEKQKSPETSHFWTFSTHCSLRITGQFCDNMIIQSHTECPKFGGFADWLVSWRNSICPINAPRKRCSLRWIPSIIDLLHNIFCIFFRFHKDTGHWGMSYHFWLVFCFLVPGHSQCVTGMVF